MTGIVVTVEDEGVLRSLAALQRRGMSPRPVLERIADDFLQVEGTLFASRGASVGRPWVASRQGVVPSLTGRRERMERSLTVARTRGGKRRIVVAPGRTSSVTMGSTHPLAHLHQGGTVARYARTYKGQPLAEPRFTGVLPTRAVVEVGEATRARWRGYVAEFVLGNVHTMGL